MNRLARERWRLRGKCEKLVTCEIVYKLATPVPSVVQHFKLSGITLFECELVSFRKFETAKTLTRTMGLTLNLGETPALLIACRTHLFATPSLIENIQRKPARLISVCILRPIVSRNYPKHFSGLKPYIRRVSGVLTNKFKTKIWRYYSRLCPLL